MAKTTCPTSDRWTDIDDSCVSGGLAFDRPRLVALRRRIKLAWLPNVALKPLELTEWNDGIRRNACRADSDSVQPTIVKRYAICASAHSAGLNLRSENGWRPLDRLAFVGRKPFERLCLFRKTRTVKKLNAALIGDYALSRWSRASAATSIAFRAVISSGRSAAFSMVVTYQIGPVDARANPRPSHSVAVTPPSRGRALRWPGHDAS